MYTAIFFPLSLSTLIGGPILNMSHEEFGLLFGIAAASFPAEANGCSVCAVLRKRLPAQLCENAPTGGVISC